MPSTADSEPSIKGDFHLAYTAANVPVDAASYSSGLFAKIKDDLDNASPSYLQSFSCALISVMLCSQSRGDSVGPWFRDSIRDKSIEETKEIFRTVREAIAIAYPFAGLPNCVPACFGLVGVLRDLQIDVDVEDRRRPSVQQEDFLSKGLDTRKRIYRGVGNPEVHWMLNKYFPDMTYATDTFIFGYLIAGSLDVFELRQTELIVTAAVLAMGATRQARSHCKASMQVGNSEKVVLALVNAAKQVANWNGRTISQDIVVPNLAKELRANLANEEAET